MGPLPVHIAVVTAAQLGGGEIDQRVGTPLRGRARFSAAHPVTERIDRGLHQRAAFGIELTPEDEDAAIGLLALEPAALVGAVVIGEHAVGVEAQAGDLGEGAHGPGIERLRRSHQDVLERSHLLDADILGEVGDHGHVAERGATGTSAVEGGRQLAQGPGQVDAVGGGLRGHAAGGSQPGHRAHATVGQRSVSAIKAVEAADALGFETID